MHFKFLMIFLVLTASVFAELGYVEPWGKDADLIQHVENIEPRKPLSLMAKLAEQVILFHHNVVTQIDGPRSHFKPSSSQYMLYAIRRYGFMKGFIMGCDRLLRENQDPWVYRTKEVDGALWKYDPVP